MTTIKKRAEETKTPYYTVRRLAIKLGRIPTVDEVLNRRIKGDITRLAEREGLPRQLIGRLSRKLGRLPTHEEVINRRKCGRPSIMFEEEE